MGGFSRDATGDNIQDNTSDASGDDIGASATGDSDDYSQSRSTGTRRSIIAAFGQRPGDDEGRESVFDETISITITISSGSVFVPSI